MKEQSATAIFAGVVSKMLAASSGLLIRHGESAHGQAAVANGIPIVAHGKPSGRLTL
jgi:hypothetical protein